MPLESVALVLGGEYFGFWRDLEIKRAIDTYSTVSFGAPFEPERPEFRKTFRPFSFTPCELLVSLETLVTGFMLDVLPDADPSSRRCSVSAYAKPAVWHDVTAPEALVGKLEFKKLGLQQIAEQIGAPFGIGVDFPDGAGKPFDKVKLDPDKKIQEFLVDLAKQRNRVLTDTRDGRLLCWQSVEPGKPVHAFVEGKEPLVKITPRFSPQDYYSEITGFGKRKRGKSPARWTEHNRWLTEPLRPNTFKLEDSERADVPEATQARLGRMFANMASFTIPDLPGWRDPQGKIWEPNTTVLVTAPGCMIYRETEMLIREVTLRQNENEESATLEVVLPGAFSGKVPDDLPWDED